jgi:hypothetical protein
MFVKTVNWNDANIATGYQLGTLPAGAFISQILVQCSVVFNAGTTNVLTFGTTKANANELAGSGDINEAVTTLQTVTTGLGNGLTTTDVGIWVKYTQTGTAATTGTAVLMLAYAPPNG